jgi:hypothetical protein
MKKALLFIFFVLLGVMSQFSCTKPNTTPANSANTYIKVLNEGENLIAVTSFPLSDGNYIILGKDPSNYTTGKMVKFNINGTILWQNSISPLLTVLWQAIPLEGGGFVAAGFDGTSTDNKLNIILYDNSGNILISNSLYPGIGCTRYPLNMVQLSNGGFAFAGSCNDAFNNPVPYILVTDNSLNLSFNKVYEPLNEEYSYGVTGLYETPDGSINISGFVNINQVDNAFLIRAFPWGVQESFTLLTNTAIFETPDCIALNNKGNIILPYASANITSHNGALVNYKGTGMDFVSGTIGISILDSSRNFISNIPYSGYSNNGLINSILKTLDGGFILCGTVNQLTIQESNTEIFVLKLDANLNKQWSNTYDTYYASFGVAACQTPDGGYLISGYHYSLGYYSNMVIIKTDANGNVN